MSRFTSPGKSKEERALLVSGDLKRMDEEEWAEANLEEAEEERQQREQENNAKRAKTALSELEMVENLQRLGFQPLDENRLQKVPRPLKATLTTAKYPRPTINNAFEYLKMLLDPEKLVLDFLSVKLKKHARPARSKPITLKEFWLCFGHWLSEQVDHSDKGASLSHLEKEQAKTAIKGGLTVDRIQTITGSFKLTEDECGEVMLDLRERLANFVNPGNILVIDETIVASNSKSAKRQGMIRYIPGKPHPKGYFINMGMQKLSQSGLPLAMDAEYKWSYCSLSMKNALMAIVHRLENQFDKGFVVIADSGYPAAAILGHERKDLRSKFICSVSSAMISGSYRSISELAATAMSLHQKALIWNESTGIVVYCHRQPTYTQVLATNAVEIEDAAALERAPYPMSFDQASVLASNFTVDEMVGLFGWPAPTPKEITGHDRYPTFYLQKMTGQDLSAPVNSVGFVTKESLEGHNIHAIRGIAEHCSIKHTGIKKEALVQAILKKHPKAKPAAIATPAQKRNREAQAEKSLMKAAERIERDTDQITEQFLRKCEVPDYAIVYKDYYGLEDRFNTILYANFAHKLCKSAKGKYTWFYLYMCLWNSYAIWFENKKIVEKNAAPAHEPELFTRFLHQIVLEIAEEYNTDD